LGRLPVRLKSNTHKSDPILLVLPIARSSDTANRVPEPLRICTLSRAQQLEQFTNYCVELATVKINHHSIRRLRKGTGASDPLAVLQILRRREVHDPGSVVLRKTRLQKTVILLGQDLLANQDSLTVPILQ
jgi:hypothetical protein